MIYFYNYSVTKLTGETPVDHKNKLKRLSFFHSFYWASEDPHVLIHYYAATFSEINETIRIEVFDIEQALRAGD